MGVARVNRSNIGENKCLLPLTLAKHAKKYPSYLSKSGLISRSKETENCARDQPRKATKCPSKQQPRGNAKNSNPCSTSPTRPDEPR
jgi:hypothetical protein